MYSAMHIGTERFIADFVCEFPDAVFAYQLDTYEIIYANQAALDFCGWRVEEVPGKTMLDLPTGANEEACLAALEPLISGEVDEVVSEVPTPNGIMEGRTRRGVAVDGSPLMIAVLRDTTEAKRAQAAKMDNFSELSHEMRTPLTSIKGALKLIEAGLLGEFSDEARDVLRVASRNTERLLALVNDILDFQKISAGKVMPERAVMDLVETVRAAIAINQGYSWEFNVRIELEEAPDKAFVLADRDQIMQVLTNLLSNAVKHSPAEGIVKVDVIQHGGNWRVSVSDNGPGIAPEMAAVIFDSFTSTGQSHSRKSSTGLGLAISKKIMLMNGGEIGFDETRELGTEFYFDLPKAEQAAMLAQDEGRARTVGQAL